MQQFVFLALHHFVDRNTRPTRNYVCNVFSVYFLFNHGGITLHFAELLLSLFYFFVQSLEFTVTYFRNFSVVAFPFRLFSLKLQILNLHLILLDLVHQRLFALPFCLERLFLLFQFGKLLTDDFQLRLVILTFDGFTLNLQLFDFTGNLIQLFRNGIHLHA